MRRFKNLCVALTFVFATALGISWVVVSRQSRRLSAYENLRSQDLKSIGKLQQALRNEQSEKARVEATGRSSQATLQNELAQTDAALSTFRRELGTARARASELESELDNSEQRYREAMAKANQQISDDKEQIQAQLVYFKQQMKSASVEVQASRLRVNALEELNEKMKKEKSAATAKAQEFEPVLRRLEALERRRDDSMASVMSHYRDISSQLQAMTGMLNANRDANANVFSSQALYRIRDTLSLANNNIRQLNDLNEEIVQVEKQLSGK